MAGNYLVVGGDVTGSATASYFTPATVEFTNPQTTALEIGDRMRAPIRQHRR